MIENYQGWEITLTWQDKSFFEFISNENNPYSQSKKWVGIDFKGQRIYGSSLKEIRHIIDYPNLHNK